MEVDAHLHGKVCEARVSRGLLRRDPYCALQPFKKGHRTVPSRVGVWQPREDPIAPGIFQEVLQALGAEDHLRRFWAMPRANNVAEVPEGQKEEPLVGAGIEREGVRGCGRLDFEGVKSAT